MNKQQQGIKRVFELASQRLDFDRGETVTKTEQRIGKRVYVTMRREMLGLPKSNMLRFASSAMWTASVGPMGKVEIHMAPPSFGQFAGKLVFGCHFAKTGTYV